MCRFFALEPGTTLQGAVGASPTVEPGHSEHSPLCRDQCDLRTMEAREETVLL
jgi:hypothetical protein